MENKRQADATIFGFQFQINAGIYLMLKYFASFSRLKIEGKDEDIEIELFDSKKVYAQAKSKVQPYEKTNVSSTKFDEALKSFSDVPKEKLLNYVYITNIDTNPINANSNEFNGESFIYYDELTEKTRKLIDSRIQKTKSNIDANNLVIVTLPFFGKDNDQKKKVIKGKVDEFLSYIAPELKCYAKQMLDNWENEFLNNGSVKDPNITIDRKNIIWNLIVFKIKEDDTERLIDTLKIDETDFVEAIEKYEEIINLKQGNFIDYNKIIKIYQSECIKNPNIRITEFLQRNEQLLFETIFPDFDINYSNFDKNLLHICSQIISYKIIFRKNSIEKIQKGVNNYGN